VLLQTREFDKALESFQKAVEINQKLAIIDEKVVAPQQALSRLNVSIGNVQRGLGKLSEASSSFQKALEILRRLALASPGDFYLQQSLAGTYERLGDLQLQLGQATEAMEYFRRELEINENLAIIDPSNSPAQRQLLLSHQKIGELQLSSRDFVEANGSYRKSLDIAQKLVAVDPNDDKFQRDLWVSHYGLGRSAQGGNDFLLAIECYEKVRSTMNSAKERGKLASQDNEILANLDQLINGCKSADLVLGDWKTVLEQPDNLLPALLEARAIALVKMGRISEAIQAVEKLRELGTATPAQLYNGACVFSLCATSIKSESTEISEEETKKHSQYIAEALATLKEAIAAGWNDFELMKTDSDLAPLRDLEDFKKLFPGDTGK
jgi:tetratricopeptide (TPR) repeat protein